MTYFDVALKVARNTMLRYPTKSVVNIKRNMLRNNATMAKRNNTPPTKGGVALLLRGCLTHGVCFSLKGGRVVTEHLFDTYSYREV